MLNDFERKILRIIVNYAGQRRRMPRMDELENKTGRSRELIRESLLELERRQHINWDNKSTLEGIQILQAWEQEPQPIRKSQPAGDAVKYFWNTRETLLRNKTPIRDAGLALASLLHIVYSERGELIQIVGRVAVRITANVHFPVLAFKHIHTRYGSCLYFCQRLLIIQYTSR